MSDEESPNFTEDEIEAMRNGLPEGLPTDVLDSMCKKFLDKDLEHVKEEFNVDFLLVIFENTAIGIPENYYGSDDYWDNWFDYLQNTLHRMPATKGLDFTVLTEVELRERWSCNRETLIRILENYDLRMEHKKIKNYTGTYHELSREYIGYGFFGEFAFHFFDLAEDALFRAGDLLSFEQTHPEVMEALQIKPQQSDAPPSLDLPLNPPVIPPPPPTTPDLKILVNQIEDYAKDNPPVVKSGNFTKRNQDVDKWLKSLAASLKKTDPELRKVTILDALTQWNVLGESLPSRSRFYTLMDSTKLEWEGPGYPRGRSRKKSSI
jgi:hypothetical protein